MATSIEIHVAAGGSDAADGADGRPLATLHGARDRVRELRRRCDAGAVTVWVHGGTYYLASPLVLTPSDSGTADAPVSYAAWPGDRPTLSGGIRLACRWEPFRDGLWKAGIPGAENGALVFNQLFINGKRQIRARYPNYEATNPLKSGPGWINAAPRRGLPEGKYQYRPFAADWQRMVAENFLPHEEFSFDPATFSQKRWAHPEEAVVHAMAAYPQFGSTIADWGSLHYRARGVDWDAHTIRLGAGGWQVSQVHSGGASITEQSRFYVENVFEELDAPHEWYLDSRVGVLYYYPPEGLDLASAVVEVALRKHLVEFRGCRQEPVRHIALSGFRFAHTAPTFLEPYETPSLGDWTIYRGGAVLLEGTADCAVEGCFFDAVGGNGVFLNYYNRGARIRGNIFTEAGDSAVCLVGRSHLRTDRNYTCPFCGWFHAVGWDEPSLDISDECEVGNNLIHDIGVFGKQTAGVFVSLARKIDIRHNHIFNLPRAAICVNDGQWGGHRIEFNDIHDTVRETGDHGPFNAWGREPFWCSDQSHGPNCPSHPASDVRRYAVHTTVIRNNRFRDRHGWGIDLDDGASNYFVYGNLCLGVSLKLREGAYRCVENNVFVNPAMPPSFCVGYEDNHDRVVRNIIVTSRRYHRPELDVNFTPTTERGDAYHMNSPPLNGPLMEAMDYNLFFNDTGEFGLTLDPAPRLGAAARLNLEQWRALGFDRHSICGDPRFVDAPSGDYRLRKDSPALALGFRNLDLDRFGLTPDFPGTWREDT